MHQCNGHELWQTPGDGEGQGGLACCSAWGHKESDTTRRLNNNNHQIADEGKFCFLYELQPICLETIIKLKKSSFCNIYWIIGKAREFQKNIYFCFTDYGKAFNCVDHNKLWKILKEMGIPDHLTCLLRNLYASQEAIVRTGHGTMTGSKLRKEYIKAVYCHSAYLTYLQSTSCKTQG